jgi:phosphatidylinositol alpha-1,6-mannosyltransferase
VIWDCVDLDRFKPGRCPAELRARYGIPDKDHHFVIMTLGRISARAWHKGYERLLEAFTAMVPGCPNARLVYAGTGDSVDRLKEKAAALGVGDQVLFTGSVLEDDLPCVYQAASLFSLVSDRGKGRGEGIPLTPLEAGACGAPIMVGNQDGSQEAVVDGKNGFVCPSTDVDRQAAILREMYADPQTLSALGAGAVAVARSRFGYPRFVEEHREAYGTLALGRNASEGMPA